MNNSSAENLIRSAKAPTISAGVSAANVNWKVTNTYSGIVSETESAVMPLKNAALYCNQSIDYNRAKAANREK